MERIQEIKNKNISELLRKLEKVGCINIYKENIEEITIKHFGKGEREVALYDDVWKLLSDTQEQYFKLGMLYGELERLGNL